MAIDLKRAQFYMNQRRYKEAQSELTAALAEDPNHGTATAMLAYCLHKQKRSKEGKALAQKAVGLSPQSNYPLNILGHICIEMKDYKGAEKALRESLRINPYSAHTHGLLALTLGALAKWMECLEVASAGLKLNPDDTNCHNARVKALSILGRSAEAHQAVYESMSENSEEPLSQASAGWAMLRMGRVKEAIEHFREALRLDPNLEWAREGMIEALRARFLLYRIVIGWRTWLARLPQGARYAVTFGLYFMARAGLELGKTNPWLIVPGALYLLFVFFTWVGGPILNLFLLAHPLGRIALSRDDKKETIMLGSLIGVSILGGLLGWLMKKDMAYGGAFCGMLGILFTSILIRVDKHRGKTPLVIVVASIFLVLALVLIGIGVALPNAPGTE